MREEKYSGSIVLVSDETHAPYQRPPLSKAYLKGSLGRESLVLRGAAFYDQQRVDTKFGDAVVSIDRAAKRVCFGSGRSLGYEHLILATGARARPAPFADADLAGVVTLRNLNDADQLKQRLEAAQDVVVVGAGFIGLGSQPRRWPRQTRHSRGSRAARHGSRGLAADFRLLCDSPS